MCGGFVYWVWIVAGIFSGYVCFALGRSWLLWFVVLPHLLWCSGCCVWLYVWVVDVFGLGFVFCRLVVDGWCEYCWFALFSGVCFDTLLVLLRVGCFALIVGWFCLVLGFGWFGLGCFAGFWFGSLLWVWFGMINWLILLVFVYEGCLRLLWFLPILIWLLVFIAWLDLFV